MIDKSQIKRLAGPTLCLRASTAPWGDERWADRGCGEDLEERALAAWDGSDKPFVVECDCGRLYEYTVKVVAEAERKDL